MRPRPPARSNRPLSSRTRRSRGIDACSADPRRMNFPAQDIVAELEQRRFELNANLLKVYNYYRVVVGLALLGMFLQQYTETRLGRLRPDLFLWTVLAYTAINLVAALVTQALPQRLFRRQYAAVGFVLFDIMAL